MTFQHIDRAQGRRIRLMNWLQARGFVFDKADWNQSSGLITFYRGDQTVKAWAKKSRWHDLWTVRHLHDKSRRLTPDDLNRAFNTAAHGND